MKERKNKTKSIIAILLSVIAILLIVMIYAFAVKPAITGNMIKNQNEGYAYAIVSIIQQASTCNTVPLTFGNQTIEIVSVECVNKALEQQSQPQ